MSCATCGCSFAVDGTGRAEERWQLRWIDYYELFGLVSAASAADIKYAFRSKVAEPGGADGGRFSVLSEAYEVISDHRRRAAYDRAYRSRESTDVGDGARSDRAEFAARYAGFWVRLVAFLFDTVAYPSFAAFNTWVGIWTILMIKEWNLAPEVGWSDVSAWFFPWGLWVAVIFALVKYCEGAGERGKTWGCDLVGIRIVRAADGSPPGGRVAARILVSVLSRLVFWVGYLWMLRDDKKQTWHDKAAGTIVVYAPNEEAAS